MLYCRALNAQRFIRFLTRLTRNADPTLLLILDNLKVHHALKVRDWLATR